MTDGLLLYPQSKVNLSNRLCTTVVKGNIGLTGSVLNLIDAAGTCTRVNDQS